MIFFTAWIATLISHRRYRSHSVISYVVCVVPKQYLYSDVTLLQPYTNLKGIPIADNIAFDANIGTGKSTLLESTAFRSYFADHWPEIRLCSETIQFFPIAQAYENVDYLVMLQQIVLLSLSAPLKLLTLIGVPTISERPGTAPSYFCKLVAEYLPTHLQQQFILKIDSLVQKFAIPPSTLFLLLVDP